MLSEHAGMILGAGASVATSGVTPRGNRLQAHAA